MVISSYAQSNNRMLMPSIDVASLLVTSRTKVTLVLAWRGGRRAAESLFDETALHLHLRTDMADMPPLAAAN